MNDREIIHIYSPDDSGKYHNVQISTQGDNMTYTNSRYSWVTYTRSNAIYPSRHRNATEPTIAAIKSWLQGYLGWGAKNRPYFDGWFIIHKGMEQAKIYCSKLNTTYSVQGMSTSKDTALTALSRTLYRACFTDDTDELVNYCFKHILLPENISYALENRAPYHWYKKGVKVDVRFNVKMIGPDECAMEISDGVWAAISAKSLNTYMNYYWKNQKSSSWAKSRLTPKKLWTRLLKTEPTEGQVKMMIAFLEQNRTDDLVQKRAYQLVKDMEAQYENRLKVFWDNDKVAAMLVRGKIADWVITDNQYKTDIQAVSTFVFKKINGPVNFFDGELAGPICIDNMTKNSSVGDQFAARAFALLNDSLTVNLVSTIKHYLNDEHYENQIEARIMFDDVTLKDLKEVLGK